MVSLVNSHSNDTSKRQHLQEIDLGFALNSTPGWEANLLERMDFMDVCMLWLPIQLLIAFGDSSDALRI